MVDDPAVEAGFLTFAVTDNGIGVPAEFAEKVFVIFQRLHGRETYGGTGIGLSLCKKIVEHAGGRIRIDTEHREGTRIVFTLPDASATTAATAAATASADDAADAVADAAPSAPVPTQGTSR